MGKLFEWARSASPWILHLNCGSCNGCDIETLDSLMPRYDLERFGVLKKDTPRHADVLVCTGPVTRQMEPRLERIYEQMPEPKLVVAAGSCAASGGVFQDCYNCHDGVDEVIPVDMYVPGCPISPEALIDGLVGLLEETGEGGKASRLRERSEDVFEDSDAPAEVVDDEHVADT